MAEMTKPTRPPIDWEAIEREYRAGQLSLREIEARYPITRAAIQKRAKVKGWKRDLAERVRKAIAEKVVAAAVAPEVAAANDEATVDAMADRGAAVQILHQKRAARLAAVVDKLVGKLDGESELPITMLAQAANNLANANKTLTGIERQAFGISDDPDKDPQGVTIELVRFGAGQ